MALWLVLRTASVKLRVVTLESSVASNSMLIILLEISVFVNLPCKELFLWFSNLAWWWRDFRGNNCLLKSSVPSQFSQVLERRGERGNAFNRGFWLLGWANCPRHATAMFLFIDNTAVWMCLSQVILRKKHQWAKSSNFVQRKGRSPPLSFVASFQAPTLVKA